MLLGSAFLLLMFKLFHYYICYLYVVLALMPASKPTGGNLFNCICGHFPGP